jgi:hypothetical protein
MFPIQDKLERAKPDSINRRDIDWTPLPNIDGPGPSPVRDGHCDRDEDQRGIARTRIPFQT